MCDPLLLYMYWLWGWSSPSTDWMLNLKWNFGPPPLVAPPSLVCHHYGTCIDVAMVSNWPLGPVGTFAHAQVTFRVLVNTSMVLKYPASSLCACVGNPVHAHMSSETGTGANVLQGSLQTQVMWHICTLGEGRTSCLGTKKVLFCLRLFFFFFKASIK